MKVSEARWFCGGMQIHFDRIEQAPGAHPRLARSLCRPLHQSPILRAFSALSMGVKTFYPAKVAWKNTTCGSHHVDRFPIIERSVLPELDAVVTGLQDSKIGKRPISTLLCLQSWADELTINMGRGAACLPLSDMKNL